ncbi:MAG: peptide ABC transporter substrate-binding protein [Pyrinomonadaceae bacterium]
MRISPLILRIICRVELAFVMATVFVLASCTELKRPEPNPYLSETQAPQEQEFRWSNGGKPKSVDPAKAETAPETDIVRALFEGLTDVDPETLEAVPGVAEKWYSSEDNKIWTFEFREDAKWSNGKPVTAFDFVRSWQRLLDPKLMSAHKNLLENISRVPTSSSTQKTEGSTQSTAIETGDPADVDLSESAETETAAANLPDSGDKAKFDVTATNHRTLVVKLEKPDRNFPNLVAHPIFLPVFGSANRPVSLKADKHVITNGAFKIEKTDGDALELARSETYWNHEKVRIERVVFVPVASPDEALEAYRNGKVDAVTNAEFAPLAQKMFTPYADFRKSVYAALNFYEINHTKPPFNDRRIREALAISIEREKLSNAELEGTTRPALSFLPFATESQTKIVQDKERARELFEQAGFADGRGFPVVKLVINRNETQQRVAREVMKMWKTALNIETDLVVKENDQIDEARSKLDYDVLRRNVVFQVADELAGISAIHQPETSFESNKNDRTEGAKSQTPVPARPDNSTAQPTQSSLQDLPILSEETAIHEMHAIPLYFPMSFSLVKPYVSGFEMNMIGAQSFLQIAIDSDWQPR